MDSRLTEEKSRNNYYAFIWHGIFLSLAKNFMDIHTIIPSMLIKAGGNAILLGILTTIMIGGSRIMKIVFGGYLSNKTRKKSPLLLGINLRVLSLLLLAFLLFKSEIFSNSTIIILIFMLISIFSFSGSFASISYVDIIGKSIIDTKRKHFFSLKQTISSIGIFGSAIMVRALLKKFSYPVNYGISLLVAGILLFVASLGFWKIKEVIVEIKKRRRFREYIKIIPQEISKNSNLKNYLFIINLLGLGLSFIPFVILFAKKNFELSYGLIGNILLYKIIGMLVTSFVLYKISNKIDYKKLLYFSFTIGISLPIFTLIFSHNYFMYQLIFIFAGVFLSSYNIAKSGILVEISNNENRATYTGISGAGSFLPTLFPLLTGILITILGYYFTFILVLLIIASSVIFINNLKCKKVEM